MSYLTHRPARGGITHRYGAGAATRFSPASHTGTDFGWGGGTGIYAARAGRVKSYAEVGSYGNRMVLDHGDGRETWYCHLKSAAVRVGQQVSGGDFIAVMGATGNVTAMHLHFMIVLFGWHDDPEKYLPGSSSAALEIEDIDMATAEEIAQAIWTHMLTQSGGAKGSGRAADWLVNLPDQVGPSVWSEPLTHKSGAKGTAAQWLLNTSDMVGAVLAKPSTVIDPAKLAAALTAAGLTVTIDAAAIAKAVDASLRDDFAAIPGAVVGGLKAAL